MEGKILKTAASMDRPAKKAVRQSVSKLRIALIFGGLAALVALRKWRRSRRPARALRNPQGVGPAHIKGVTRGEEQGLKHPHEDNGHAAGHLIGSIDPS